MSNIEEAEEKVGLAVFYTNIKGPYENIFISNDSGKSWRCPDITTEGTFSFLPAKDYIVKLSCENSKAGTLCLYGTECLPTKLTFDCPFCSSKIQVGDKDGRVDIEILDSEGLTFVPNISLLKTAFEECSKKFNFDYNKETIEPILVTIFKEVVKGKELQDLRIENTIFLFYPKTHKNIKGALIRTIPV